jgi:hypothetical protein
MIKLQEIAPFIHALSRHKLHVFLGLAVGVASTAAVYERLVVPYLRARVEHLEMLLKDQAADQKKIVGLSGPPLDRCDEKTIRLDVALVRDIDQGICLSRNAVSAPSGQKTLSWYVYDAQGAPIATCVCEQNGQPRSR